MYSGGDEAMKTAYPLLHPPLQLIRKTPVCPRCGLPVKWYDLGDGIYIHECVSSLCENWQWLLNFKKFEAESKRHHQAWMKRQDRKFQILRAVSLILIASYSFLILWSVQSIQTKQEILQTVGEIWNGGELD